MPERMANENWPQSRATGLDAFPPRTSENVWNMKLYIWHVSSKSIVNMKYENNLTHKLQNLTLNPKPHQVSKNMAA